MTLHPDDMSKWDRFWYELAPRSLGGGGHPVVAVLLSLTLCGLGQLYNGDWLKCIIMMVTCFFAWLILLGWVVHIWSIINAYRRAKALRREPTYEVDLSVFE